MISPILFATQAIDEVRKVVWPKREEVIRLSVAVIIISVIVGIFLGSIDWALTKLLQIVVTK